ncbi:MAG: zf-HC2 domain-containing protein [Actinobacteria bacterium]|nr:zf-HC2 domain-containing protein [Actinomycetota bacterium]
MRCKKAISFFSAHLEGELPADREGQLRAHLDSCPDCRALLEAVDATVASLHDLPEESLSPLESERIGAAWRAALDDSRGAKRIPYRGLARTATALGAVMVLGAAVAVSFSVIHHPTEVSESPAAAETTAESEPAGENNTPYVSHPELTNTLAGDQSVLPQVVNNARVVAAADMSGYAADVAQKQTFYSAVWQDAAKSAGEGAAPAYDTEALKQLQGQCTEDMVKAAEGLGEDATGLRSAVAAVLAKAANRVPLLPCWAEKVLFEGKPAWIISLSGPDEGTPATGKDAGQVTEPPPGELVWSGETPDALPRYLFVVDVTDLSILFE